MDGIPREVLGESETVDVHSFLGDQNKMKDFISCRNCKQEFDHDAHKPFLLPCLDAICKSCTQEVSESQSYECSNCRCSHICFQNGHLSLQSDNTREIATEIFCIKNGESRLLCGMCTNDEIASHRCFDCSVFICEDCVKLHLSLKTLKSHSFMEIKCLLTGKLKNLGLSNAPKHCLVPGHDKEQLKMYCLDPSCMKNVCILCAISTHKDHNLSDITEVGKEFETKMETCLKSIEMKVKQANACTAKLTSINGNCLKDSQQFQLEVKNCFSGAKKAIDQREKDLCDAASLYLRKKQMCIENETKKITSYINSCKKSIQYGKVSSELNGHQNFIEIAKMIQPRLENLDYWQPENNVTVDTMAFSSRQSDSSYATAVNSLGKLSVSKVCQSKSKIVVTPPISHVGKEMQFKIRLFSSTGNLIVDENVNICLKTNGKMLQFLNCAFESSSSSFTGIWIPEKPMKICWTVVSNDIEHKTLNGIINVTEIDTRIAGSNIITEENENIDLKWVAGTTNKRAERTYAKTEITNKRSQFPEESDRNQKSYDPYNFPSICKSYTSYMYTKMLEVKTKEDLRVKIYGGRILCVAVDCIVNASNEYLMHGGGVAAAISEAAGYEFDRESREFVKKNGPISVGTCCVTSAGKLPYKCVIHTVGPRWSDYKDKNKCLQLLQNSVEATFIEADKYGMKSIAIPSISSGIFAVPRDLCVQQYYKAAMSFSRNYPFKNLREIHFVDKDESMVLEIQNIFQRGEDLQ